MMTDIVSLKSLYCAGLYSAVSSASDCRSCVHEFEPPGHISFIEINHEIISTAIFPLPLIQKGQLSVTGKRMYT